ncbi:MAG: cupin domain-containing protein [Oligoflexia bacterium]|nr:cupin domain-containing protein [Oligoflexia bacterium]
MARANTYFRNVILTSERSQVVLMSIEPGDDIGEETHDVDQVLLFVEGEGVAVVNGVRSPVKPGHLVEVTAGSRHNFLNTGRAPLKLVTFYAPPEEAPGTVHRTKEDAIREMREKPGHAVA